MAATGLIESATMNLLELLNARRSVPARQLGEPAPHGETLDALLAAAIRVPDHGKLVPWRLLLLRGDARTRLGDAISAIHRRNEPDVADKALAKDRERFGFAPLVVIVIARIESEHPKIPAQEQLLSAGCVAHNLLIGAHAQGFAAQWLTGWPAYDREVASLLGLAANERVIGFIHIGTAREEVPERGRPEVSTILSEWHEPMAGA
ncbi:MAG: nitroreductase [Rhodanobacteraceae bacterium]